MRLVPRAADKSSCRHGADGHGCLAETRILGRLSVLRRIDSSISLNLTGHHELPANRA